MFSGPVDRLGHHEAVGGDPELPQHHYNSAQQGSGLRDKQI